MSMLPVLFLLVYVQLSNVQQYTLIHFHLWIFTSHLWIMEAQYCHMSPVHIPNESLVKNEERKRWSYTYVLEKLLTFLQRGDSVLKAGVFEPCRSWVKIWSALIYEHFVTGSTNSWNKSGTCLRKIKREEKWEKST